MTERRAERYARSLDEPDETLTFPRGYSQNVRIGETVVGRLVQQPGWRWSEQVKPIVGTDSCQYHHVGVGLSGHGMVRMDDGTEFEIRAGDVFDIPPGHDQWVLGDEPAVAIIWGGWRGFGKVPAGERVLRTLLMTDIAGSTELAARLGDAAWDRVLERHNDRVRAVLELHHGHEVDTTGDGFLATFDGAARVEALAEPSTVWVSRTVTDLVIGSNLGFRERGDHRLKGVPEERRVYVLLEPAT